MNKPTIAESKMKKVLEDTRTDLKAFTHPRKGDTWYINDYPYCVIESIDKDDVYVWVLFTKPDAHGVPRWDFGSYQKLPQWQWRNKIAICGANVVKRKMYDGLIDSYRMRFFFLRMVKYFKQFMGDLSA